MDRNESIQKLNKFAYVVVDDAVCFYEPDISSAIRIVPPYGSEVEILSENENWVLLKWCGKEAWINRYFIENSLEQKRENKIDPSLIYRSSGSSLGSYYNKSYYSSGNIEYGPRGGRYTRTKNGFRRYF